MSQENETTPIVTIAIKKRTGTPKLYSGAVRLNGRVCFINESAQNMEVKFDQKPFTGPAQFLVESERGEVRRVSGDSVSRNGVSSYGYYDFTIDGRRFELETAANGVSMIDYRRVVIGNPSIPSFALSYRQRVAAEVDAIILRLDNQTGEEQMVTLIGIGTDIPVPTDGHDQLIGRVPGEETKIQVMIQSSAAFPDPSLDTPATQSGGTDYIEIIIDP
ncbi:MAG: hypothetical protein AAF772_11360 [Acidobacteriota bacterium]